MTLWMALLAACQPKGPPPAFSDCDGLDTRAADVQRITMVDDDLEIRVGYGGGCEDHLWSVCWPDRVFQESAPVRAHLALWHDSQGDDCDAYLTDTLLFDVDPVKEAWLDAYGPGGGTFILVLEGEEASYSF